MAETDVSVSNKAIRLIGANPITALNDGSTEADIISEFYDNLVADVFGRYPWSFATKKVKLVASTTPLNKWNYAHSTPTDMRRLVSLYNTDDAGAFPINRYEIQAPVDEEEVFSDYEELWADYIRTLDESNWPAYFVTFFSHTLASHICEPITDQTELSDRLAVKTWGNPSENMQGGLFAQCAKVDSLQQPPKEIIDSPLVQARFS